MINKIANNKSGVKYISRRKWDSKKRILASIEKARKMIGYEPKIDFEQGLTFTINWFEKNWDLISDSASFGPGMSSAVRDE